MGLEMKKRNKVTRKRRPIILIAAEGDNRTEKIYFNNFNMDKKYSIVFSKGRCTDPINMVTTIEKEMKQRGMNKKDGDIAYCVFDTDCDASKQTKIDKVIKSCERKNIEIIQSNPCFEVWFIAHFTGSTKLYNTNEAVIKELRKHVPGYEKNESIFNILEPRLNTAIKNAKKLENYHKKLGRNINSIECNPSTKAYKIIEKLQSFNEDNKE